MSESKQNKLVHIDYKIPKTAFDKLDQVSKLYSIPKTTLLTAIIDNKAWKRNLPEMVLETSDNYVELLKALNYFKQNVGMIGNIAQENNNLNKEYLKAKIKTLDSNNDDANNDNQKLDTIINNQEKILDELKTIRNTVDNEINPILDKLWLNKENTSRKFRL